MANEHQRSGEQGTEEAHLEGYSTDLFADAAIDFLLRSAEQQQPWFVYLPFNAPHFPNPKNKAEGEPSVWQAPTEAFARYGYDPETRDEQERYHAVVTALDTAIGRVLEALDRTGLAENTFVFFYSDNGAFMLSGRGREVASNAPLRDGGVTCWEGGLRVAAVRFALSNETAPREWLGGGGMARLGSADVLGFFCAERDFVCVGEEGTDFLPPSITRTKLPSSRTLSSRVIIWYAACSL